MARMAYLRCLNQLHPDILLPNQTKVILGRGPETRIKNKKCSREQMAFQADYKTFQVQVEQLGSNPGSVQEVQLHKGQVVHAGHGDVAQFLVGDHGHKIVFQPEPGVKDKKISPSPNPTSPPRKKARRLSHPDQDTSPKFPIDLGTATEISSNGTFSWKKFANDQVFVMTSVHCHPKSKIAAFDMDGTLITTKSGKVFPVDIHDWQILFADIPGKLKSLIADDYKIVVLTNQAGIAKGKLKVEDFQKKVENIAQRLGVPIQLFCCAGEGYFRKPRIGVWEILKTELNSGLQIDMDNSFYCGDAAGRDKDWRPGKKKDFSCSDRLFALNLGLKFFTPEEFFLNAKPCQKFTMPEFDPKSLQYDNKQRSFSKSAQEVVLMVGIQGSGKSHLARAEFGKNGYIIASNDETGSRDKTLKLLDKSLSDGLSVVVDNTNGERDTRAKFINIAKKHKVTCRCLMMKTSHQHARHNNLFRELTDKHHTKIRDPLFYSFKNKFQPPTKDEGFSEILEAEFIPNFRSVEEENLYKMFLLEK